MFDWKLKVSGLSEWLYFKNNLDGPYPRITERGPSINIFRVKWIDVEGGANVTYEEIDFPLNEVIIIKEANKEVIWSLLSLQHSLIIEFLNF